MQINLSCLKFKDLLMMNKNTVNIMNFRVNIQFVKKLKPCDIYQSKDFIICSSANYVNSPYNFQRWTISFIFLTLSFLSMKDIIELRRRIGFRSLFETNSKYNSIALILLVIIGLPNFTV
jgi:hypothetical protein